MKDNSKQLEAVFGRILGLFAALGVAIVVLMIFVPTGMTSTDNASFDRILSYFEPIEAAKRPLEETQEPTTGSKVYKYIKVDPSELQAGNPSTGKPTVSDLGSIKDQVAKAIELVDTGNPQEAAEILEKILKQDPNNEQALVEMGMIQLIDFRKPGEALPYLEKALNANPENRIVISELVGLYDELNLTDSGISKLKAIHESNPDSSVVSLGLGQMLSMNGRKAEAAPYLEAAAKKSPESAFIYGELADIYRESGQNEKAIQSLDSAIAAERQKAATDTPSRRAMRYEQISHLMMEKAKVYQGMGNFGAANALRAQAKDMMKDSTKSF